MLIVCYICKLTIFDILIVIICNTRWLNLNLLWFIHHQFTSVLCFKTETLQETRWAYLVNRAQELHWKANRQTCNKLIDSCMDRPTKSHYIQIWWQHFCYTIKYFWRISYLLMSHLKSQLEESVFCAHSSWFSPTYSAEFETKRWKRSRYIWSFISSNTDSYLTTGLAQSERDGKFGEKNLTR